MTFNQFLSEVDRYKLSLRTFGGALKEAKANVAEMVGEGINTWHDFLAQPEVGLSTRDANTLIQLYDWLENTGTQLSQTNLSTAKFCAQKGIIPDGLEGDIQNLTLKDFKERHYDVQQGVDNADRTYTYMVMKRCNETGTLSKVHGVETDELEEQFKDKINESI